jgi:hypothetical protein
MVSKYKNIRKNGFDSKVENKRYAYLQLLEKSGLISNLKLQPKFTLQKSFKINEILIRGIEYRADFSYNTLESGDKLIVEDVKGFKTDIYKIKKKIFLKIYGETLEFKEIELKNKNWVETKY